MEIFNFSNSNIDLACENVGMFLAKADVERREALRIKLTFEEALIEYQAKFGEEVIFYVKLVKRLSSIKVEIIVEGESYNPLVKNSDEGDVIQGLLAGIGLAPTWSYKNGKNYIVFTQLGIPAEAMGIAIALNAITDFPLTAMNLTGWQITLVDVADSLDMLDKETLHKNKTN